MEHHETAAIQGANLNKEPQGGDGTKLPLRLFIYAGDILPGGEAYLRAVEGGTILQLRIVWRKRGKINGNLVHSYLRVSLLLENLMLGRPLYGWTQRLDVTLLVQSTDGTA